MSLNTDRGATAERARRQGPLLVSLIALLVVHLPVFGRYGIHRDEMYFVECGKHLAAGYVDHPPLVPWIARIACELGGCSVYSLRLPSLLARLMTVALTVILARRLGGRGLAQLLAGLAVVFAPAFQRMGKIICIPVFEPVFWTIGALILLALARGGRPRLWLALGIVVGLGLLNKHTMLLWAAGAGLAVLASPLRSQLRTPWPWLAVALSLAISLPNLLWQTDHGWATLEFLRSIRASMLADIPRSLFLLGQLLYMHPFSALLWGAALAGTTKAGGTEGRPFVWIFMVALAAFLLTGAKPYYLAPAYPPLFALGAMAWERWLRSQSGRAAFLSLQVATGLATTIFTLPFFSLTHTDAMVDRLLGRVVPAVALTHDLHDEYGWRELAHTVATVLQRLPPAERDRTTIVTANYGQAAAINHFSPPPGLRASTGHMTFFLWGPANPTADILVAVGMERSWLVNACGSLVLAAESDHPLALPHERHVAIHLCRELRGPLPTLWPTLKRFHHGIQPAKSP
jgi:4-amino-4-deoxy-L-arabinose transferase-like glycosyltransferase